MSEKVGAEDEFYFGAVFVFGEKKYTLVLL